MSAHLDIVSSAVGGPPRSNAYFTRIYNEIVQTLPSHLHVDVALRYSHLIDKTGTKSPVAVANQWLRGLTDQVIGRTALLADDADALAEAAERYSAVCARIVKVSGLDVGEEYAAKKGLTVAWSSYTTEAGRVARLGCAKWWRRQLRVSHWRQAEHIARQIGAVSSKSGRYASVSAVSRRQSQNARNEQMLASINAIGPDGVPRPLLEVASHTTSNKTIRRYETLARIRGLDDYAKEQGYACQFITLTAPSKYHATKHNGKPNKKYNGSTPRETNDYLLSVWARVRVYLDRAEIPYFGMRVAEPHHDGTPHHHFILYTPKENTEQAWLIFEKFAVAAETIELKGDYSKRVKRVKIDSRGVTGYVLKYVAKNLDGATAYDNPAVGEEMTGEHAAARVDTWASHNGIRQFAFFGAASVGVWRELRTQKQVPEDASDQIKNAHAAARAGDYHTYLRVSDGLHLVTEDTGYVTEYDSIPIMQVVAISDQYDNTVRLQKVKWEIRTNNAMRNNQALA